MTNQEMLTLRKGHYVKYMHTLEVCKIVKVIYPHKCKEFKPETFEVWMPSVARKDPKYRPGWVRAVEMEYNYEVATDREINVSKILYGLI